MSGSILDQYAGRLEGGREPVRSLQADASDDSSLDATSDVAAEDLGSFGWHRGTRDFPRMLELRKKDGDIVAIAYAYIERVEFDKSGTITLHAHGRKLTIKGRHLNAEVRPGVRLFQGIVRQRVGWVSEVERPSDENALTTPVVSKIDG